MHVAICCRERPRGEEISRVMQAELEQGGTAAVYQSSPGRRSFCKAT